MTCLILFWSINKCTNIIFCSFSLTNFNCKIRINIRSDRLSINNYKIKLISNNPKKRAGLIGYGLEIVDNVHVEIASNPHNEEYLKTKRDKMGHNIMSEK